MRNNSYSQETKKAGRLFLFAIFSITLVYLIEHKY